MTQKSLKACEPCRKRKIKCDGIEAPCPQCISFDRDCVFDHHKNKRKVPQRSAKRIDDLTARVSKLERLLEDATGSNPSYSQSNPSETTPYQNFPIDSSYDPTSGDVRSEETQVLGAIANVYNPPHHMPPVDEATALVRSFFDGFNNFFPLFDERSFMSTFSERYESHDSGDPIWWAKLSVVLSLAYEMQAVANLSGGGTTLESKGYLQNALKASSEIALRKPDLEAVEAVLGTAFLLAITSNPSPGSTLIAAAIRMSHSLRLHQYDPNSVDGDRKNRVFWIAYLIDKDYSIRFDHPPLHNDFDIGQHLPDPRPYNGLGDIFTIDWTSQINFFRLYVDLAVVQGKLYSSLHSIQSRRYSRDEQDHAVATLTRMLESWTQSIPQPFRPENMTRTLSQSSLQHMIMLYLKYFHCLALVHGVKINSESWKSREGWSNVALTVALCKSNASECVSAARVSLRLARLTPQGDYACHWLSLYHWVSAVVVILLHAVQEPNHAFARSDLELVESCLGLLDLLMEKSDSEELRRIREFCDSMKMTAKTAVGMSTSDPSISSQLAIRG